MLAAGTVLGSAECKHIISQKPLRLSTGDETAPPTADASGRQCISPNMPAAQEKDRRISGQKVQSPGPCNRDEAQCS